MKIERVKELIEQVKRHVPEGGKFCVYGHATLVLEGTAVECATVSFVVDIPTHIYLRKIYGECESRLEGSWVGNNEVRIYTGYVEAMVKMVDGIPCRHEAHPDFDADVLSELPIPVDLILTGRNVDVADAVGDYLGLGALVDGMVESRSAGKSLLRNPISLKDTPYGEFQAYRRTPLGSSEYRARKLALIEEELKFTEDEVNNRRRLNNASLHLKVRHKRAVLGLDRAVAKECLTARCTQPLGGHIEPEDHTVDSIMVGLGRSGLVRKQLLGEGFYKPGMGRTLMGLGPMREPQEEGAIPKPVQDTIEKFIGEEADPVKQTKMGADIDGDFVDGEYYLDPVGKAQLDRQKARDEDKKEDDK